MTFWFQLESRALTAWGKLPHLPVGSSVFSSLLTRCLLLLQSTETGLQQHPPHQAQSPSRCVQEVGSGRLVPLQIHRRLPPDDSCPWGPLSLPYVGILGPIPSFSNSFPPSWDTVLIPIIPKAWLRTSQGFKQDLLAA